MTQKNFKELIRVLNPFHSETSKKLNFAEPKTIWEMTEIELVKIKTSSEPLLDLLRLTIIA
jgi:hypothetical protein